MTRISFPFRNLWFFLTPNLLIVIGVAIGTAVLTGALLLGDSLKGSLKQLTLDRLGNVEAALASERFFPASLADRLQSVPIIILRGTALRRSSDGSQLLARAGHVQVLGVDSRFWPLFNVERGALDDGMLINQALADALQFKPTDTVELRMEKQGSIPSESVLGQRSDDPALVLETSQVADILPSTGVGRFTLQPVQGEPLIAYVKLEALQRRLADGQLLPAGSVNAMLVPWTEASKTNSLNIIEELQKKLQVLHTLEDLGFLLQLNQDRTAAVFSSRRLLLEPQAEKVIQQSLATDFQVIPTLTYLANRTFRVDERQNSQSFVPYSTVVGVTSINGIELKENAVVINEFVADDLGKDVSTIRIEYFVESEGHQLREKQYDLKVIGTVAMTGQAADRTWTPEFPGMKGTLAEWSPPFPKEQWHPQWVRKRDEDYYKQYRATPKLFIHPATAKKLFSSRFGDATSLRIQKTTQQPFTDADIQQLRTTLTQSLSPADFGMVWQDLRKQGMLAATQGGTTNMFGGLFAGFSLFLIVAAALLVALLFRLRLDRRASEVGLLQATGWPIKMIRWAILTEGFFLACLGAIVGIPLALGYAWLMIYGLRQGWGGLLASDSLSLHFTPITLLAGAVISVLIALLSMFFSLRNMVKLPAPILLAGRTALPNNAEAQSRKWVHWFPALASLLAMGLLFYGKSLSITQQPGCFFGAGFLFLLAAILFLRQRLRQPTGQSINSSSTLWNLGQINVKRSPSRSLLTITLLAAGCFLVVAVGAFRKGQADTTEKSSGTGGFTLFAECDVPLRSVPHTTSDWQILLGDRYDELKNHVAVLNGLNWYGLRLRNGEDVSCLNLYQPTKPRILGTTRAFNERGGFTVTLGNLPQNDVEMQNPWMFLETTPALNLFIDDHTAQWVLQKQLNDMIVLEDENSQSHSAIFAGMINGSIFQSELILNESQFRKLFPSETGYRFFLIDTAADKLTEVRTALEMLLGESHGMTVNTTASKLAAYHTVENTYIGTFQALGGLGLLLGTAGLALVILRNVQERQSELAVLQAFGFTRSQIARSIFSEVAWIVVLGIAIGSLAAMFVVLPLINTGIGLQLLFWMGLVLLLVPLVALLASLAGIKLALSKPLIPALRGE